MGMILGKNLRKFLKGYATRHPVPWVAGATLVGDENVYFGDLVKLGDEAGTYEAIGESGITSVDELGGFVLATNVKLADADFVTVPTRPGEQFNLIKQGYMAIELDSAADADDIKEKAGVNVILATGKCTTAAVDTGVIEALPNVVFTGQYEVIGSGASARILAEILIK